MSYYDDKRISNSGLSKLNPEEGGSPQKYLDWLEGKEEKNERKYLERGTLLHTAVLEPDLYSVANIDRPSGKTADVADLCYEAGGFEDQHILDAAKALDYGQSWKPETRVRKIREEAAEYYAFLKESTDKLVITRADKEIVDGAWLSVQKHPIARNMLFVDPLAEKEVEIYETIPLFTSDSDEVGVEAKCRIDCIIPGLHSDKPRIERVSLKTTGKALGQFHRSYFNFRYYRQDAFYHTMLLLKYGLQSEIRHTHVVVETSPPYNVGIFTTEHSMLKYGKEELFRLLRLYYYHKYVNNWQPLDNIGLRFDEQRQRAEPVYPSYEKEIYDALQNKKSKESSMVNF